MPVLIGPATVVTADAQDRVLTAGGVLVSGGRIAAIGDFARLQAAHPQAAVLAAAGGTITPGLINAHAHFYGLFARGLALVDPPPQTFRQVLERLWWRLDRCLDADGVYFSALLGGIAALRAGCTTVFDHHASPRAVAGSLDRVAAAMSDLGLRACLCYEVSDRDGPEAARLGIRENARFLERMAGNGGLLAGKFGLHAAFTLTDRTLAEAQVVAGALGAGCHIHCAEGPEDGAHSRVQHGQSSVERLLAHGILGPKTILAHCVHISAADMGLLAETGTTVSHQPHSNMGNAVGWARMLRMQEQGIPAALGTDGYIWDMLASMRTAALLHSHMTGHPGAGVSEFAGILLKGNAELASRTFDAPLGRLEPGAMADLVLWDYAPLTPLNAANWPWHLQFGLNAAQVRTVLVNGRTVLQDRALIGVDEAEVIRAAQPVVQATWERFRK